MLPLPVPVRTCCAQQHGGVMELNAVSPSQIFNLIASDQLRANGGRLISDVAAPDDEAENPTLENPVTAVWPRDYLRG